MAAPEVVIKGELVPWKGRWWKVASVGRDAEKVVVLLESRGETGGALKRRLAKERLVYGTNKRPRLALP